MLNQVLRPRRMRISKNLRAMVRETSLSVKDFIYPLFLVPGTNVREEIPSMPGCCHLSVDQAVEEAKLVASLGIPAVEVFGIPEYKDEIDDLKLQIWIQMAEFRNTSVPRPGI